MKNFKFSRAKANNKNCRKPLALAVGLAQLTVIAGFGIEIHAAPEGGRVVQGVGNIEQNANITNVNQVSDLLTVEWSSFDLDSQEVVNFLQPNNHAWVLNHILQNGPSQINGQINANGNVLLINPRGMIFGENALINAGSFTASSLWLDKEDFLNGHFYFKDVDPSQGRIINHGLISAATGGFVNLLGESISNEGILSANMGYVSLAAGSELYLTFDDQNFLGVKVTQEVINNDAGLKAAIDNKGKIEGESARVIMQAESAKDLFDLAVNHEGVVEATGFDGGEVSIAANGAIKINGNIDSSGDNNSGSVDIAGKSVELLGDIVARGDVGGRVWVQAEDIQLAALATVDVSGQFGGGQALIGGGYLGRLEGFRNAQNLYVAGGAKIYADAKQSGNGGEVILWSDNSTHFHGLISAQGGTQSGDGGLVETSSLNQLSVSGKVSTHARSGQTGTWLLDPGELEIVTGMAAGPNQISVSTIDLVNNNVVITTSDYDAGMAGSGNLTLSADISSVSGNSLTLQAETDIILNNNINITGDINLDAQNQVFINSNITAANINLDMLSYSVDPTALLSTAGSLSFNYKTGNHALDLNNLGLDFNNISASAINFNLGAGGSNSLSASTTGSDFFITAANALNVDVLAQTINFTGVNSIAGSNNNDSVDAANSGVQLGLSSYTVNDIDISDINSVSNTDSITGTSSAESFTASAENQITVSVGGSNVVFDDVASLDGGSGTGDSLDVSNQGAVLSASGFDSRSITVSDVELVNNTTTLTGTSNDDSLTVTASKQLLAGSTTFNNVDSYDAAAGTSDTLDLGGFGAVLDGQNYTVNGISVTQNEINDNVAQLTGGGTIDTFVVQGSASVTANGSTRTYNGVTTVVTQADDIVNLNDQGALIGATGFSSQGIGFDHASALNTGVLTGGTASDTFVVQGAESVTVDAGARTFNGVSAVFTQADDVVNLNDQDALITANGFSSQGINFDHAAALNTGVLTGTAADESFSASAENEVSVVIDGSNRVFGGVDSLDGAGGTADSLDLSAQGATLTATGFNSRGIGVSNIESATNTVTLTGSAADDSVAITGAKEISTPSISFSGVDNYNAADGSADVVDANNAGVQLDGSNYIINGVLLSNNETANNVAQLTGGGSQDNFRVEGLNSISVASGSRHFNDVDSLISQADDVLDLNGQDATLSSTGFSSQDIDFSHGSASNTGELTGTSGNDQFDASATNQVTVNINGSDTVFSGVNEVIGGGGDDQADLNNSNADLVATGFDSRSITFSGIGEVIETDELTATAAPEHFVIDGAGGITVNGIRFNGVTVLDGGEAGDDSDQDRISGAVSSFLLAGDESVQVNHLQASSFTANNIELLSGSNATLHGASGDVDTFLVSGLNTVAARDMVFEGVASVISNAEDTVDLNNLNATLSATGFVSQNIAFDHSSAINTGTLTGTTNSEAFTASAANQISVQVNGSNRSFDGVNVLAGGSATGDSLDVQSQGVNLTGAGFSSRGISVSDVALVNNSSSVLGTAGNDAVTVSANKQLSYNGISFNQVDSYDAGAGSNDTLDASAAGVSIAGTDYTVNGVVVSNNEITNDVAVLTGNAAAADNFIVQGSGSLTANSSDRTYNGVTEVVSQSNDTVDLNDQNATLTATGFSSQNIAFDHATAANTGTLTGTNNSEAFTASANNQISVQVNGSNISFDGVDALAGGSAGSDSLDVQSQGVNLTATGFSSRGISVSDVALVNNSNTVSGTSADDAVTISANKQLSYNGISFNQVDSYDADAGSSDTLDASAAGVSIAGTGYTVNGVVVSNNEVTNNVAVLTGNAAAADNFIVQSSGSLTANSSERTYNGVTAVVSQTDDTVDLNDQNATVTASGFNSQGIDFSHELVSNTGTLAGTSGDDSFISNSANEIEIDINGAVVTFSGVDQLDGVAGNDELDINNSGAELTASGVLAQSINVSNVANYRSVGALLGSAGDDSFDFIDAGAADASWNSNTALFWGVTGIDAAAGTDSVIGTDMVDQFALVASASSPSGFADNQVTYQAPTTSGILIENIEAVDGGGQDDILAVFNTGLEINSGANIVQGIDFQNFEVFAETGELTLLGNNASTSFLIEADGQVRDLSTGVLFIGVDALIGDVGLQNQVDLDGAGATLQAGGFNSRNIDISRITQVSNTGQIFGANENYQVQGNQSVLVNNINFAGVSEVNGGSSVVLNNAAAVLNGARLISSGISFVNINSFSQLSDLSGVQSFTVLNDNEIQTAGFRFSGLSSLEATSGDIGSRGAQLRSAGEILAAGISIRGLNAVSNTGQLIGTGQAERYELLPNNQLTIAGIQFSAVTGLDGAGGLDTIDLNGLGADLQSDGFTVGDFRISNIEEIANTGTVRGSTQGERFQIESNGSISVSGFNFSDVNVVDAGEGRDSLDVAGRGLNMLDLDSFSVEGITFSGVELFSNTGALVLTDADDILSRDEEDKFSLLNYEFAAVSSVDAGAGNNSLQLAGLGLKVEDGSVTSATVDLSNIQSFTQVGELALSGFDANVELLAEQSFRVNGFQLQDVQILQAGAGSDRLDAAGFDSLLLENNNLLIADTEIRSIELIDNTRHLTGNNSDNSFSLLDIGIVESGSYQFTGVERIDGGGGQDSLSFAAVETVAIDFETSAIGSIDYDGVEALQRFESIEQINLPNVQSLLLSGDAQLQVGDLNLDGDLNLAGQVQLDVAGDAGFTGGLAISDDSQLNVSGTLQALGTINSSGAATANIDSNVILGNGLQATDSSVITVAGDLSSQGDIDVIDEARLVLNGGLSTDTNLNLDGSGQLQVEGSVDVGGDLNALGQSNINSNSDINIVGQVTTSQTATINADSINVNVPEEKVVTVQPEINISLAVFSEIKVFINSNSSVRNSAETSALYSDDDLVDALIESAQEEEMDGAGEE
ncbi:filamentous hemagglutinin N-terminal domain-containing protein [uncultured Pseudoteredinibacter sp.]|uniref:filamentous hemagglutinin N-terminal domain-containing protein n=1 Tax=uncultured Pseudoteredinibacter sp. TaxID=1641701 RepID=UPI002610024F|nr:filamentous hemagglutinin N-terminal domain-containing protein [uncultured Pseudoteredinibacter sp.]